MARNPIVNADGRTSYYTNSGVPYTTVSNPTDVNTIDKLAQPRDNNFTNKDASGTRVSHSGPGIGLLTSLDGKNTLWDNQDGTNHGNVGEGVGVVKVTGMPKRYQSQWPAMQDDIPFIQYGGMNRAINGRRLNGTSRPSLVQRNLHMRETVTEVREFELVDPKNPFLVRVKDKKNVSTYFPLEVVDTFVVKGAARRFQNIPLERSWTDPAIPFNTDMDKMPYLNTVLSMDSPYIRSMTTHIDELTLDVDVEVANGGAAPDVDWGDASAIDTGVSVTHTYAATGIYTVTVTSGTDVKTETFFMKDALYAPIPLSIVDPLFVSPPGTKSTSTTVTVDGTPFIKVFVDWGDGFSGSIPQGFDSYMPTTQTELQSTFDIAHTYTSAGSYVVRIFAEHLIESGLSQERKQVVLVKTVMVS